MGVLADVSHQFPNLHGDRLLQIGELALLDRGGPAAGDGPAPARQPAAVRHAAAAAYARLLLSGRFKLQGALGPAGCAVVGADPKARGCCCVESGCCG